MSNQGSFNTIALRYGICKHTLRRWVNKYNPFGENALLRTEHNQSYPLSFKLKVVETYSNGEGSQMQLATKFKIPSDATVHKWILKYNNSHNELKSCNFVGTLNMTIGRKTTSDERIEIVKYCIEHQNNYAKSAEKYNVSYQQVYSWYKNMKTMMLKHAKTNVAVNNMKIIYLK